MQIMVEEKDVQDFAAAYGDTSAEDIRRILEAKPRIISLVWEYGWSETVARDLIENVARDLGIVLT